MDRRVARSLLAVQWACPGRSQLCSQTFLVVGVLLLLPVPGSRAHALQGQPDWSEEISLGGSVAISAYGVSRSEAHRYLERLGLTAGAVADPRVSVSGSDAFHGVREARANWAARRLEVNGKFAVRQFTEVLGLTMAVTSVISTDGLLATDDRGGSRVTTYRKFPLAACYRGPDGSDCDERVSFDTARDGHGTIVEFVRDRDGFPSGVRFGETLALRYHFTPPLPEPPALAGDRWREPSSWALIDLRTSEVVIDSVDAAKVASKRPVLSVVCRGTGEVLRFEDGQAFAVAQGIRFTPHALLPLEAAPEIWRSVYANGDGSPRYGFRVDYTDDLVRIEIATVGYGERSIVVEAPRHLNSVAPVSFVHPRAEMLTDAMRSGVRLRITESLDPWLHGAFEKERLPIVLRPLRHTGIEMERGVVREAARSGQYVPFGPADGCEVENNRVLCTGGASDVIGEESPAPW